MTSVLAPLSNKPFVSFALFTYNQERYVAEALQAAFAQEYSPLQIVISDDASSDRTWEIIQLMVTAYRGPHSIVINHNNINLGIGAHVNKLMSLVEGEIVVVAAGDDISRPDRTSKIVDRFLTEPACALVHSAAMDITANGETLSIRHAVEQMRSSPTLEDIVRHNLHYIGATGAWRTALWEVFGDLNTNIVCEDRVLPPRAAAVGTIGYLDDPLVYYRNDGISSNFSSSTAYDALYGNSIRWQTYWRDNYRNVLSDLDKVNDSHVSKVRSVAANNLEIYSAVVDLAQSRGRLKLGSVIRLIGLRGVTWQWKLKTLAKYLLPTLYMRRFERKLEQLRH